MIGAGAIGQLIFAQKALGAAELREVADDRGDLLAQVAGLALGSAKSRARSTRRERGPWPSCAGWLVPTRL